MTLQELKRLYEQHNVAPPHNSETCEMCIRWKRGEENPYRDMNGQNY